MPTMDIERSGSGMQASLLQVNPQTPRCGNTGKTNILLAVSCAALLMSSTAVIMTGVLMHRLAPMANAAARANQLLDQLDSAHDTMTDIVATTFDEGRIKQTVDAAAAVTHKIANIDWELNPAVDKDLCYETHYTSYCTYRPQSVCHSGGRVCTNPHDPEDCREYGAATLPDGGTCTWSGDQTGRRLSSTTPSAPKRRLLQGGSCSSHGDCYGDQYCDSTHNCYDCSYVRSSRCDAFDGDCSTCGVGSGGCTKLDASGNPEYDNGFPVPTERCVGSISSEESREFDRGAKKVGDALEKVADSLSSAVTPGLENSFDVNAELTSILNSDWKTIGGQCKSMLGKASDMDWSAFLEEDDANQLKSALHGYEELCAKIEAGF